METLFVTKRQIVPSPKKGNRVPFSKHKLPLVPLKKTGQHHVSECSLVNISVNEVIIKPLTNGSVCFVELYECCKKRKTGQTYHIPQLKDGKGEGNALAMYNSMKTKNTHRADSLATVCGPRGEMVTARVIPVYEVRYH